MKQFFKLNEHKNDKNTAFAGSLHAASWLGGLALLKNQFSPELVVQATHKMRSDIWFRQPVRSDFCVVSETITENIADDAWQISNHIEDDEGLKVEAVHQSFDQVPSWALSPRVQQLLPQSATASVQQLAVLQHIQQKLHDQFAVVAQLPIQPLQWCSTPSGEPALQLPLFAQQEFAQKGSAQSLASDAIDCLRQQILLGYLAGWSLISALTAISGNVDVLVSRVFAVADHSNLHDDLASPIAILATPNSETHLLQHLQTYRSARAEVLVRSGVVLMKGLFHVRYV